MTPVRPYTVFPESVIRSSEGATDEMDEATAASMFRDEDTGTAYLFWHGANDCFETDCHEACTKSSAHA